MKTMENTGTRIVGKIKINKQARFESPLTQKPFANLKMLLNAKKYGEVKVTVK